MAVISEVKCGRCDRRYSGFRSRCPYCGARRNKRGKHADEADNAKAKLVIGVLLLVLLIAATMVLIFTNIPEDPEVSNPTDSAPVTTGVDAPPTDSEDVTVIETSPSAEPSPSPSESPTVEIAEVIITYLGKPVPENDLTLGKIGESLQMGFTTVPEVDTEDKTATWESSNKSVFEVLSNGKITAIGKGSATLKVTVDGVVGECIVRVRG